MRYLLPQNLQRKEKKKESLPFLLWFVASKLRWKQSQLSRWLQGRLDYRGCIAMLSGEKKETKQTTTHQLFRMCVCVCVWMHTHGKRAQLREGTEEVFIFLKTRRKMLLDKELYSDMDQGRRLLKEMLQPLCSLTGAVLWCTYKITCKSTFHLEVSEFVADSK